VEKEIREMESFCVFFTLVSFVALRQTEQSIGLALRRRNRIFDLFQGMVKVNKKFKRDYGTDGKSETDGNC
jgi:hypothetical protein